MRLGFRFVFFLILFVCLSFPFHYSGELLGHDILKNPAVQQLEENYIEQLVQCKKEDRLQQLLERYRRYYRFNGSVLAVWKGNIVCNTTMGYADFSTREPLTTHMPFQLASVSKQFTAAAIMLLKQQGKLNFDDEIRKYIPRWPYAGMTIRHLLNHTAGLPNYMWLLEHKWSGDRAPYNHEVVAMLIKHHLPLNFVPGKYHAYSNTGYVVLAYLVEKISGEFFADFLHNHFFEPLGMKNTFAYSSAINRRNRAKVAGYMRTKKGYRVIDETVHDGCMGDKGIYSTAEDLYLWDQALYSGRIIKPEILEEAFTMCTLKNKRRVPYGFGFRLIDRGDSKTVYHHGLWNGFRTSFVRYVTDSCTIIVLNNTNSDAKYMLVKEIEKILLSEEDVPADDLVKASVLADEEE
ncbi:MAG: hypothetical protein KatS3mg031_0538 [Chitinophagales bacterium]|nr:MAG: hypothetical protein KatS3mg031_0538 [Chitinophagales bacterium]